MVQEFGSPAPTWEALKEEGVASSSNDASESEDELQSDSTLQRKRKGLATSVNPNPKRPRLQAEKHVTGSHSAVKDPTRALATGLNLSRAPEKSINHRPALENFTSTASSSKSLLNMRPANSVSAALTKVRRRVKKLSVGPTSSDSERPPSPPKERLKLVPRLARKSAFSSKHTRQKNLTSISASANFFSKESDDTRKHRSEEQGVVEPSSKKLGLKTKNVEPTHSAKSGGDRMGIKRERKSSSTGNGSVRSEMAEVIEISSDETPANAKSSNVLKLKDNKEAPPSSRHSTNKGPPSDVEIIEIDDSEEEQPVASSSKLVPIRKVSESQKSSTVNIPVAGVSRVPAEPSPFRRPQHLSTNTSDDILGFAPVRNALQQRLPASISSGPMKKPSSVVKETISAAVGRGKDSHADKTQKDSDQQPKPKSQPGIRQTQLKLSPKKVAETLVPSRIEKPPLAPTPNETPDQVMQVLSEALTPSQTPSKPLPQRRISMQMSPDMPETPGQRPSNHPPKASISLSDTPSRGPPNSPDRSDFQEARPPRSLDLAQLASKNSISVKRKSLTFLQQSMDKKKSSTLLQQPTKALPTIRNGDKADATQHLSTASAPSASQSLAEMITKTYQKKPSISTPPPPSTLRQNDVTDLTPNNGGATLSDFTLMAAIESSDLLKSLLPTLIATKSPEHVRSPSRDGKRLSLDAPAQVEQDVEMSCHASPSPMRSVHSPSAQPEQPPPSSDEAIPINRPSVSPTAASRLPGNVARFESLRSLSVSTSPRPGASRLPSVASLGRSSPSQGLDDNVLEDRSFSISQENLASASVPPESSDDEIPEPTTVSQRAVSASVIDPIPSPAKNYSPSVSSELPSTTAMPSLPSSQNIRSVSLNALPTVKSSMPDLLPSHLSAELVPKDTVDDMVVDLLEDKFNDAMEVEECAAVLEYVDDEDHIPPPGNEEPRDSSSSRPSTRRSSTRRSSQASDNVGVVDMNDYVGIDVHPLLEEHHLREPSPPSVVVGRSYGGLKAHTWADFRGDITNFTPKCYYAHDLPHSLQDHINVMSEFLRMHPKMRAVFETSILENTVEDEPDAPPIKVFNIQDDEPTPPWEFHYSNKMWHGEGVPPPDVTRLESCDCVGKCDPRSKTCACVKRQRKYTGDPSGDFAFDLRGRLKIEGYPIFECNDLCGCDDDCRNRVVQHGRTVLINIAKTEFKGWGVFAGPKRIPKGTFIGIYAGELLTDAEGEARGVNYNKFGRTYLFDLDFHHLKAGIPDWDTKYVVDAYHAGNFTRFLNHSCDPNCGLFPCYINESNIDKPLLTVFATRDIEPEEEICFNYSGDQGDDDDNGDEEDEENLRGEAIYVKCMCEAARCTGKMFK